MTISAELRSLLVCPRCRGPLDYRREPESLVCTACRLQYRVEGNIPVMLVEEARVLDGLGSEAFGTR